MPARTDLGQAHSVELRPSQEDTQIYTMHVLMFDGNRVALAARREALRGLWSYLTQILYPRAIDITQRVETVTQSRETVAPNVTYRIIAYCDTGNRDIILIGGFAPGKFWNLKLGWEACENLWVSLQDHLDQI